MNMLVSPFAGKWWAKHISPYVSRDGKKAIGYSWIIKFFSNFAQIFKCIYAKG